MKKLTILIPCLNEVETIGRVIEKSLYTFASHDIAGEILVADNGSIDGSQELARSLGARVINVQMKGYGSALIAGINSCESEFVVMGDADDSYALDNLGDFISSLQNGSDLVIGNRFKGGIAPGAMPWLHRYVGNPLLSWLGRLFFKVPIGDFHCGLRGFKTDSIRSLNLKSLGMEFASEMIVKASLSGLKITEVPTSLSPDGRSRPPHLRTWRDGWRHLVFLLAASPRWLFLYPGFFLAGIGLTGTLLTLRGPAAFGPLQFDLNSFLLFAGLILIGTQTIVFGILAHIFSTNIGTLPISKSVTKFTKNFTLERGILLGLALLFTSLVSAFTLLGHWNGSVIVGLNRDSAIRLSSLIVLTSGVGAQTLFASFFASMLHSLKS
jgi:glycosyltransferase involved in cell wall biosynthesis